MPSRALPDPADLSAVRRHLHAHPELGFCEVVTADLIWQTLTDLGWSLRGGRELADYSQHPGRPDQATLQAAVGAAADAGVPPDSLERFGEGSTAICAEWGDPTTGPTFGVRIDMDALPVTESQEADHPPVREGFRSRVDGVMHACGHDGHVAIGLGLAAALTRSPPTRGAVRLIFQPAEEGVRGAQLLRDARVADDLDFLIAPHIGFGPPTGSIAAATHLYATTKIRVRFQGVAAHAAKAPHQGQNALLAAATATLAIHGLPTFGDSPTTTNVGSLHAPGAPNIVPAEATLTAETRAADSAAHRALHDRALTAIHAAAAMHGTTADVEVIGQAEDTFNDSVLTAAAERSAREHQLFWAGDQPLNASDDASLLMNRVHDQGDRALYLLIGSDTAGPQHSNSFDFDERSLSDGVDVLEATVRTMLESASG